jgi:hypothetical protein
MQLERANVVLRPRTSWEAIDLGLRMARRWYRPLWLLWIATALPLFLIVHLLLHDSLILALVVFWWMKPVFEPLLTVWLGHALFSEEVPLRKQLGRTLQVLRKGLPGNLLWRRLSPSRSFLLCVQQLEGLRGDKCRSRMRVLERTNPNSGWLTILMLQLEMVLALSIAGLVLMLLPETVEVDLAMLAHLDGSDAYAWFNNLSYFAVASLIAPFYVAAGFSLYINSRTELEAWDIEIAFRQMIAEQQKHRREGRLAQAAVAVLFSSMLVLCLVPPREVLALDREQARESIAEVLAHRDFGERKTVTRWEAIPDDTDDTDRQAFDFSSGGLEWLAGLLRIAAYAVLGLFAGWLIVRILGSIRSGGLYRKRAGKPPAPEYRLLQHEEGNVPIPANPVDTAIALCEQNELRKATSLLYRATLERYIRTQQIDIPQSATEKECLELVHRHRPAEESSYFGQLTHSWQWLAYAGEAPPVQQVLELCHQWREIYPEVPDAK